jgi:hypothetical protein
MHGDGEALVIDPTRLDRMEQRWVDREHQKQMRAQGLTSKYVPHQGAREKVRLMKTLAR